MSNKIDKERIEVIAKARSERNKEIAEAVDKAKLAEKTNRTEPEDYGMADLSKVPEGKMVRVVFSKNDKSKKPIGTLLSIVKNGAYRTDALEKEIADIKQVCNDKIDEAHNEAKDKKGEAKKARNKVILENIKKAEDALAARKAKLGL